MIAREEIYALLQSALVELFEIPEEKVHLDANVYEELDIDSIDAIDLMDFIYKKTGYKLQSEDFHNVRRIGDIVDAVYAKQATATDSPG